MLNEFSPPLAPPIAETSWPPDGVPSSNAQLDLSFVSPALPNAPLALVGLDCRTRLSELWAHRLLLERSTRLSSEELESLLRERCAISPSSSVDDAIYGVLHSITQIDNSNHGSFRYLAVMVPRVALLEHSFGSRIHQDVTVKDLLQTVLERYGLHTERDLRIAFAHADRQKHPERDYVVQYRESDWSFLARWLEREGLFYWFEHVAGHDRLVVADANANASVAPGVEYRARNDLAADSHTLWNWDMRHERVCKRVVVRDYDGDAGEGFQRQEDVDLPLGFGTEIHDSDHVDTGEQAARAAQLRAERQACRRRRFLGTTDALTLRAGGRFFLRGHHEAGFNREYLITGVDLRAGEPVGGPRTGAQPHLPYAFIEAIESSVPYRPARRTPWPRIDGVVVGHVAAGLNATADMDERGRYRVRLTFDIAAGARATVSRWMRLAQPAGGRDEGSHFPLRRSAEVLVAHVGGDPDRPVIVGCVPNAHNRSPTVLANKTQSVIRTASGIRLEMEDLQAVPSAPQQD